jgi:hypothetical protein
LYQVRFFGGCSYCVHAGSWARVVPQLRFEQIYVTPDRME